MDALLAALAALKAGLELATFAQTLIDQHSHGSQITDAQALELRTALKRAQEEVDAAWSAA